LWFECEGKIKLISKGADSTMFERLSDCDENKNLKEQTEIHLKEFGELVLFIFNHFFSNNQLFIQFSSFYCFLLFMFNFLINMFVCC
jgi:hypothetical protein